ncbi:MAG: rRNA maturation RNase YbeY [Thermincolia bacterium]
MRIFVSNLQEVVKVEQNLVELVKKTVETALAVEGQPPEAEVSVVLVDDGYIQELNRVYRTKDCPTDVLSFAMLEEGEGEPVIDGLEQEELILGDIVISLETATRQAAEYNHSFQREIAFLTTHGVMHLLGYDHGTEEETAVMRSREEAVLEKLGLSR